MHIAKHFQNDNSDEVLEFIENNGFGILISQTNGRLWGTHIPLLLSEDRKTLQGHISKANPQWKNFISNTEVMAIFSGPHAYVSSSWYTHENVPTWNYIAAHVYGKIRITEGNELLQSLVKMVDKYEKRSANPVSIEKMSAEYVNKSMAGIVGFEIEITEIQAAYKLSQNRDSKSYQNVVRELERQNEEDSLRVAQEMKKKWPNLF